MYKVIVCHNCGQLLLAKSDQRTRRCPHCETRIIVERAKVVGSARTGQEASRLIRALKQKREATEV